MCKSQYINKTPCSLVFDLDGTIIDTSEDIAYSVNYLRKVEGLSSLRTEDVLKAVGLGLASLLKDLLGIDEENSEKQKAMLKEYREHYNLHQGERSKPYPGIDDALEQLCQQADLYVLSNKPVNAVVRELELAEMTKRFKCIWGGGSFDKLKPDPIGINQAMKETGSSSENTIMIGDLFVDMETAARAGVHSIFVSWGFGVISDVKYEPSLIVNDTNELVSAVNRLLAYS